MRQSYVDWNTQKAICNVNKRTSIIVIDHINKLPQWWSRTHKRNPHLYSVQSITASRLFDYYADREFLMPEYIMMMLMTMDYLNKRFSCAVRHAHICWLFLFHPKVNCCFHEHLKCKSITQSTILCMDIQ